MRINEQTIYTFDELSDNAKEHARQSLNSEHFWSAEYIQSLKAFAAQFGIKVTGYQYGPWDRAEIETDVEPRHFRGFKLKDAFALPEWQTGYCLDVTLRETFINEFKRHGDVLRAFNEAMDTGIKECRSDWESQFEDEYILDHCTANGYEFDLHGNLI